MSNKLVIRIFLAASVMLLALGISSQMTEGSAQARPQIQTESSVAIPASSQGDIIPYPGYLNDAAGLPVPDGAYDFAFTLYAAETGSAQLWSETQSDVPVQGGAFQALLGSVQPIPSEVLTSREGWLEVDVRGPGETAFTTLSPRQRLADAAPTAPNSPSAPPSCPHDHVGEVWSANIAWSNGAFKVLNYANGPSIWGWNGGGGNGIRGTATGSGLGVFGESVDSTGIVGRSTNKNGVEGISSAPDVWAGVYGEAPHYGVFGRNTSGGWWGVFSDGGLGATGNLWVGGNSQVDGTKSASVHTDQGERLLYSEESTQVWFSDYGFGKLQDGLAVILIDPLFAQTVNLNEPYHVFLQVYGNAELYVTDRSPTQFLVHLREGDLNVEFSYRIVAIRLGYEGDRLEPAPWENDESLLNPVQ